MSRSYKKNPIYKDSNKWAKKYANRVVRNTQSISSGNSYRKVFNSWDICDWYFRETWEDFHKQLESEHSSKLNTTKRLDSVSDVSEFTKTQRWYKQYFRK